MEMCNSNSCSYFSRLLNIDHVCVCTVVIYSLVVLPILSEFQQNAYEVQMVLGILQNSIPSAVWII